MSSLLFFCSMIVRDIYHHVEQIKIFVVYDFLADFEDFVKFHDTLFLEFCQRTFPAPS